MKLSFVEVAGFRGFRERVRFDLPGGFVVLSGRNGSGKSTLLDAVDFAITGNINKFAVKGRRGHGLEDHIWWAGKEPAIDHYVEVGFVSSGGRSIKIRRTRESGCELQPEEILRELCVENASGQSSLETLMQTTLIRDEFIASLSMDLPGPARFEAVRAAIGGLLGADHSKRIADIVKAAKSAVAVQESRCLDVESDLSHALTDVTEARSVAERSTGISDAVIKLGTLLPNLPDGVAETTEAVRNVIATRRVALRELERLRLAAAEISPQLRSLESVEALEAQRVATAVRDAARDEESRQRQIFDLASQLDTAARSLDALTSHLSSVLEHGAACGLQDGHCPLCAAPRTQKEFDTALATLRGTLAGRGRELASSSEALKRARAVWAKAQHDLALADRTLEDIEAQRASLHERLRAIASAYTRLEFVAEAGDPSHAQQLLFAEQAKLVQMERALSILESSAAIDRVKQLEARITALRQQRDLESGRLLAAMRAREAATQIESSAKTVANQILTEQFDTVVPVLKELFKRLRPHVEWNEIDPDFGGKVQASLNFVVGEGLNPQFLFSSGQRRAAGLAFLFAVHLSRPWCAWQSLLLDDPVQHIDDYRALNLVEVLSAIRRGGRQVIVAVEDAALADLLCRRLRSSRDDGGRHFELRTSTSGTAEIATSREIYPMPRLVLRPAQAS